MSCPSSSVAHMLTPYASYAGAIVAAIAYAHEVKETLCPASL